MRVRTDEAQPLAEIEAGRWRIRPVSNGSIEAEPEVARGQRREARAQPRQKGEHGEAHEVLRDRSNCSTKLWGCVSPPARLALTANLSHD